MDIVKKIQELIDEGRITEPTNRGGEPINPFEEYEWVRTSRGDNKSGSVPETTIK